MEGHHSPQHKIHFHHLKVKFTFKIKIINWITKERNVPAGVCTELLTTNTSAENCSDLDQRGSEFISVHPENPKPLFLRANRKILRIRPGHFKS
jgi:hypothetical protein